MGYPYDIIPGPDNETVEINCFSFNLEDDLTLFSKSGEYLDFNLTADVQNDLVVTNFKLNISDLPDRKVFCQTYQSEIASPNFVEIMENEHSSTIWSEWSHCNLDEVGQGKVNRTRTRSGEIEIQERYCRCADLQILPEPR